MKLLVLVVLFIDSQNCSLDCLNVIDFSFGPIQDLEIEVVVPHSYEDLFGLLLETVDPCHLRRITNDLLKLLNLLLPLGFILANDAKENLLVFALFVIDNNLMANLLAKVIEFPDEVMQANLELIDLVLVTSC